MAEYYPAEILAQSRKLYERIKSWATDRTDVTLVGGWAVYELVAEPYGMLSRDVDLIMHDQEALTAFSQMLPGWNLRWRTKGRNRFNDCQEIDDPQKTIVVDVFKDHAFDENLFTGIRVQRGVLIKSAAGQPFIPSLDYVLRDKIETIPVRVQDVADKRAKDLLDVHALIFHNRERRGPRDLLNAVGTEARRRAAELVPDALEYRRQNRQELEDVREWLVSDPDLP